MADDIRLYTISVCVLVILIGTPQLRRWMRGTAEERLHWLSTIALNLAILLGTADAYRQDIPGGTRLYLVAVAVTWLLAAVLYQPVHDLLELRKKETP